MIEESISGNSNCRSTTLSYPPKPDFSLSLGGRNSCRSTLVLLIQNEVMNLRDLLYESMHCESQSVPCVPSS